MDVNTEQILHIKLFLGEIEKNTGYNNALFHFSLCFVMCYRYILAKGAATYQSAGVDISSANALIEEIRPAIETTFNEGVVSSIGSFGAIMDAAFVEYSHPLLVSGCDGVGTKLKVCLSDIYTQSRIFELPSSL